MKQITIEIPDNCELQQNGNTYIIIEKNFTYEDIAHMMFPNGKSHYFIEDCGDISKTGNSSSNYKLPNNALSKKQLEKLIAINKLMNVAKYINGNWQPDWNNEEGKYYIQIENVSNNLNIDCTGLFNSAIVYFKSEELARQAIEILGEETIKLALCTDY